MSASASSPDHNDLTTMHLDDDEKRILAECERNSLIYRSIPLGLVAMFSVQYGMKTNFISSNMKFFKLGAALFSGYLIGKVSYAPACRKKILTQIPNSNLAHILRGSSAKAGNNTFEQDNSPFVPKSPRDTNEPVVFLPDPVDMDAHTMSVGVNQYGDPIYESRK